MTNDGKHSYRAIFKGSFKFEAGCGSCEAPVLTKLTVRDFSIASARDYVFDKYTNISDFSISQQVSTGGLFGRPF